MNAPALLNPPIEHAGTTLDSLFQRVLGTNPFLDNRVNAPSNQDADVPAVHGKVFELLTGLARDALAARRGVGAVLWGEAGVGKSHLLSRLARWAARDNQACLVYLHNLQAAPEHLPRSLLRAVVSHLTLGRTDRLAGTPLYELVRAGLLEAVNHHTGFLPWARVKQAFNEWIERRDDPDFRRATLLDRTIYEVLYRFFGSAYRADQGRSGGRDAALAVRWLAGEALDPQEARSLGLPVASLRDQAVALTDAEEVKHVLAALNRLAVSKKQPFVLAFDQADNLDDEQMAALARFLEALIDSSPNLLVVTAGIQGSLLHWRESRVIQDSAWDRLAQFQVQVQRVTAGEARQLVQARLDAFLAPHAVLPAVARRHQEEPLFPLSREWFESFLHERPDFRPRDVINRAREGWRCAQEDLRQRGGPEWLSAPHQGEAATGVEGTLTPVEIQQAIDRKVGEKIAEHLGWRKREPQGLPPDADQLAGVIYTLLRQCQEAGHPHGVLSVERIPPPRKGVRPTYDLAVWQQPVGQGPPVRTGVLILTSNSATSVAGYLRRLVEGPGALDRLFLVTEERVKLPLGSRGQDYLNQLQQAGARGFRHVELKLAEHAELDALDMVVGLARCGDLEVELQPGHGRAVSEHEVVESYRRQGRYLASRLLRELLTDTGQGAAPPPDGQAPNP